MSELDPDAIRARADAATEGPWVVHTAGTGIRGHLGQPDNPYAWVRGPSGLPIAERHNGGTVADMEFAAAARTDVPALLDEVERLRAAVARVAHVHRRNEHHPHYCVTCRAPHPCSTIRALDQTVEAVVDRGA